MKNHVMLLAFHVIVKEVGDQCKEKVLINRFFLTINLIVFAELWFCCPTNSLKPNVFSLLSRDNEEKRILTSDKMELVDYQTSWR